MTKPNINELLFRCHSLADITGDGGLITKSQLEEIDYLQNKKNSFKQLTKAELKTLDIYDQKVKEGGELTIKQKAKKEELITKSKTKHELTENQEKTLKELVEKKDNPSLPTAAKSYCIKLYSEIYEGRREAVESKYLKKGTIAENEAITLYGQQTGVFFKKNDQRISDGFITGEPDIYEGKSVYDADIITDIKASFTRITFLKQKLVDLLNPRYKKQVNGYMKLTGAKQGRVAHILVNTPAEILKDEQKKLDWKYNIYNIDSQSEWPEDYIKESLQLERNRIFEMDKFKRDYPFYDLFYDQYGETYGKWDFDIPRSDRFIDFEVKRDQAFQDKIEDRVVWCRKWIKENILKEAL